MPALEDNRFCLPSRIRNMLAPESLPPASRELAKRFAGLPRAETSADELSTYPGSLRVILHRHTPCDRNGSHSTLLCRIGSDGIFVEGLSDEERRHVLARGWGLLENSCIRLFTPRSDEELEICWTILRRAYDAILTAPVDTKTAPQVSVDDLPEVSRTSLS
jgi:hypothetical protein